MNTSERFEIGSVLPTVGGSAASQTISDDVPVIALPEAPPAVEQRFRLAAVRLEAQLDVRRPRRDPRSLGRLIVVSSPEARDGKTTTALFLATALSRGLGRRVALLEVDRSRPGLGAMLGLPQARGLSDVVGGKVSLDDVLLRGEDGGPLIVTGGEPSGRTPPLASLLSPINALREVNDYVLVDCASLSLSADAALIGRNADGVLLVVRAGATRGPALAGALEALVDVPLAGCIINDLDGKPGEHALGPRLQRPRAILVEDDE